VFAIFGSFQASSLVGSSGGFSPVTTGMLRCSGDSKMKKLGDHCQAKVKSREANINVSPAW